MAAIYRDLYQFSDYIEPVQLTIHQYLLLAEEPILVSTGTERQTRRIMPAIRNLLAGKELKYVLVSHMESDECGGLQFLHEEYPDAVAVCSSLSARELPGFGYKGRTIAKKQGEDIVGQGFSLRFIDCPSEVHLQDGLVFYEESRGIFFSCDLMQRFGDVAGRTMEGNWENEVDTIGPERIPNAEKLLTLQKSLRKLTPGFIAAGHGFCVSCGT